MKAEAMTKSKKFELKADSYSRAREGSSTFLILECAACDHAVLLYQKDGRGALVRLYLDRIYAPGDIVKKYRGHHAKGSVPVLSCPQCASIMGHPMVYEKEGRLALLLIPGSFRRRKSNGTFVETPAVKRE